MLIAASHIAWVALSLVVCLLAVNVAAVVLFARWMRRHRDLGTEISRIRQAVEQADVKGLLRQ